MAKTPISQIEPNFTKLVMLWQKHKSRRTKSEIFKMWVKEIQPDEPKINEKQFLNYTRNFCTKEGDRRIALEAGAAVDRIIESREVSLIEIEKTLRSATGGLVREADNIMRTHEEEGVNIKERYLALGIVDKVWGKVQKEKEIAIKAHAEKRESVGMFAKLLRGAMSGEFTMKDVEMLKVTAYGDTDKGLAGAASSSEGIAGGATANP